MSKKGIYFITAVALGLMLTACGISEENLNKVTLSRDALMEQKIQTEELNGNLTSDSFSDELTELAAQYEEFGSLNLERLKNKDVDELIPRMDELTESYKTLYGQLEAERISEEQAEVESAKHMEILCHIENLSGSELSSICFKDVVTGATTANYLAEEATLKNGRILAGVTLPVNSDSAQWSLVVTDTLGNEYEYATDFGDFSAAADKEYSIILHVPENGAEVN